MSKQLSYIEMPSLYLSVGVDQRIYLGEIFPSETAETIEAIKELVSKKGRKDPSAQAKKITPINGAKIKKMFDSVISCHESELRSRKIKAGIAASRSKITKKI